MEGRELNDGAWVVLNRAALALRVGVQKRFVFKYRGRDQYYCLAFEDLIVEYRYRYRYLISLSI